jgi:O-antigen ligase
LFVFFALVYSIALLTFGAVQGHAYLLLGLVCVIGSGAHLLLHSRRSGKLPRLVLAWFLVTLVVFILEPRFALPVFAVGWIWRAVQHSPPKTIWFLNFLIIVGVLEALLGLIQYFVLPGWILGYQNTTYISTGTLINRNHYAGLLEMIVPATIGLAYIWTHRTRDIFRVYSYLLTGAFMVLGLIFSTSRMGIFAGIATLVVLGSTLRYKHATKMATLLALGVVVVIVSGALWIGIDVVINRYALLSGPDALVNEGRLVIFSDTIRLIRAHPWGIGIENYRDIFRRYQTWHPELLVDHSHNDYLETAAEWGILPAAGFWIGIVILVFKGFRRFVETQSVERAGILLASLGAVISILLHSLTDFNLQIPSNAMIFCAHLGVLAAINSRVSIRPVVEN